MGVGGPKDDVAARALFEKAAAQDHPEALERMGAFAQSGRGGPQDSSAARAYYEKAAALGNEDAKDALKRLQCRSRDQGQTRKRRDHALLLARAAGRRERRGAPYGATSKPARRPQRRFTAKRSATQEL